MIEYDEQQLVKELAVLSKTGCAVFAALCAERLIPLCGRFYEESGQGELAELESVLETVWLAILGSASSGDLSRAQGVAEGLVPDEDDESWVEEAAYGQAGAAATAYAARAALTGDPQDAVWAARQVYEAADFAGQQQLPDADLNLDGSEVELLSAPVVQKALAGLREDLDAARLGDEPLEVLVPRARQHARHGGQQLAELA
jgi:hypothetical protein